LQQTIQYADEVPQFVSACVTMRGQLGDSC